MTHEFYLWMSYGVFAAVIAAEIVATGTCGAAVRCERVEEERDLEAQD